MYYPLQRSYVSYCNDTVVPVIDDTIWNNECPGPDLNILSNFIYSPKQSWSRPIYYPNIQKYFTTRKFQEITAAQNKVALSYLFTKFWNYNCISLLFSLSKFSYLPLYTIFPIHILYFSSYYCMYICIFTYIYRFLNITCLVFMVLL